MNKTTDLSYKVDLHLPTIDEQRRRDALERDLAAAAANAANHEAHKTHQRTGITAKQKYFGAVSMENESQNRIKALCVRYCDNYRDIAEIEISVTLDKLLGGKAAVAGAGTEASRNKVKAMSERIDNIIKLDIPASIKAMKKAQADQPELYRLAVEAGAQFS